MITIKGPRELFGAYVNGQPNQFFPFITQAATRGVFVIDLGDASSMTFSDIRDLPIPLLCQIASLPGVSVSGYPVWIALPQSQLSQEVPDYMPEAKHEDGSAKTWADAHQSGTDIRVIDGTAYIAGNYTGQELSGATIAALVAAGLSVISLDAVREIFAADNAVQLAAMQATVPQTPPVPPAPPQDDPVPQPVEQPTIAEPVAPAPQEVQPEPVPTPASPQPVAEPVPQAVAEPPMATPEPSPEQPPVSTPEPVTVQPQEPIATPEPEPTPVVEPVQEPAAEPAPDPAPVTEPAVNSEPQPEPAPAAAAPPEGFTYQDPASGYWYNGATNQWWIPATGELIAGAQQ